MTTTTTTKTTTATTRMPSGIDQTIDAHERFREYHDDRSIDRASTTRWFVRATKSNARASYNNAFGPTKQIDDDGQV